MRIVPYALLGGRDADPVPNEDLTPGIYYALDWCFPLCVSTEGTLWADSRTGIAQWSLVTGSPIASTTVTQPANADFSPTHGFPRASGAVDLFRECRWVYRINHDATNDHPWPDYPHIGREMIDEATARGSSPDSVEAVSAASVADSVGNSSGLSSDRAYASHAAASTARTTAFRAAPFS